MAFDPYHDWLNIPPTRRPPNHYDLLGLPALEPDIERIRAATLDRTALVRRYQLSDKADLVQRLLAELSQAFDCLTDLARKQAYDAQLSAATVTADAPAFEFARPSPTVPSGDEKTPLTPRRRKKSTSVPMVVAVALIGIVAVLWLALAPAHLPVAQAPTVVTKPGGNRPLPASAPQPTGSNASPSPASGKPDLGPARAAGPSNLNLDQNLLGKFSPRPSRWARGAARFTLTS